MYVVTHQSSQSHIANAISKHYHRALSGVTLSSAAFDNINRSASTDSIMVWAAEEEHAKKECLHDVTVMNIHDIKMKNVSLIILHWILLDSWL